MTYIWLGIMLAAIVLELATPSALITIWFAFGALCAALFAYFGISQIIQILVFAIVSVLSLLIIRPMAAKYLKTNIVPTNVNYNSSLLRQNLVTLVRTFPFLNIQIVGNSVFGEPLYVVKLRTWS